MSQKGRFERPFFMLPSVDWVCSVFHPHTPLCQGLAVIHPIKRTLGCPQRPSSAVKEFGGCRTCGGNVALEFDPLVIDDLGNDLNEAKSLQD